MMRHINEEIPPAHTVDPSIDPRHLGVDRVAARQGASRRPDAVRRGGVGRARGGRAAAARLALAARGAAGRDRGAARGQAADAGAVHVHGRRDARRPTPTASRPTARRPRRSRRRPLRHRPPPAPDPEPEPEPEPVARADPGADTRARPRRGHRHPGAAHARAARHGAAPAGRRRGLLLLVPLLAAVAVVAAPGRRAAAGTTSASERRLGHGPPKVAAIIEVGDTPDGIAVGANAVWVAHVPATSSCRGSTPQTQRGHRHGRRRRRRPTASPSPRQRETCSSPPRATRIACCASRARRPRTRPAAATSARCPRTSTSPTGRSGSPSPARLRCSASTVATQRPDRRAHPGRRRRPIGVDIGDGRVWVANSGSGTVSRIDADSAEPLGEPVEVGENPRDLVEALRLRLGRPHRRGRGRAARPRDGRAGRRADPGRRSNPHKIAAGQGAVWVTNSGDDTVSQIDPTTFRTVGDPIAVGDSPLGIAAGAGRRVGRPTATAGRSAGSTPGTPLASGG